MPEPTPHPAPWPVEQAARVCPVFRHLTGDGAGSVVRDNIEGLARSVADYALAKRLGRDALAAEIAALCRAAAGAPDPAFELAERALTKARRAIEHAVTDAAGFAPDTQRAVAEIDRALAALARLPHREPPR